MKLNRFWTKYERVNALKILKDQGKLEGLSLAKVAALIGLTGANPARQAQLYLIDIPKLEKAEVNSKKFVEGLLMEGEKDHE